MFLRKITSRQTNNDDYISSFSLAEVIITVTYWQIAIICT